VLEEAPSPVIDAAARAKIGKVVVDAVKAIGYVGAGTFEFLVDEAGGFYFMEVNCRIQVEHPVTEMVTGIDLVQEQIRIAAGEPMRLRQRDVTQRGAAVECRINVEDPDRGFVPAPGQLEEFVPAGGPFVRVDTHGFPGYRVPADYDSLLAKVVVWAPERQQALDRMQRALREFRISGPGVRTTAAFLDRLIADPVFRSGEHTTSIVDDVIAGRAPEPTGHADAAPTTTTHEVESIDSRRRSTGPSEARRAA
jgi:acetyl-CoA carboxylase biotin carboxylase subunit